MERFSIWPSQAELLQSHEVGATEKEVKDVIATLVGCDTDDSRLLAEAILDHGAVDLILVNREVHQHILAETRRIIVPHRLGVAKALENRVTGEDLLTNVSFSFGLVLRSQLRKELHAHLG